MGKPTSSASLGPSQQAHPFSLSRSLVLSSDSKPLSIKYRSLLITRLAFIKPYVMKLLALFALGSPVVGQTVTSTALATPVSPSPSSAALATSSILLNGDQAPGSADTPPATSVPVSVNIQQDGKNVTITGTQELGLDKFFGIPYANPPTGQFRFARPQAKRYNGSVLAQSPGPACLQPDEFGSAGSYGLTMDEDCLNLNIIAPAGNRSSLPVMVWIHGGAFYLGTGAATLSSSFVEYGARTARPFVYVTINYRLGVFGFGHGNVGLWDQRLALEWIKRHIKAFGGDLKKVTAFGQGAGAASIGFHLLNKSQDLFRGAIMQSGAPGVAAVRPPDVMARTVQTLASLAGCNGTAGVGGAGNASLATRSGEANREGKTTLQCLRNLSAQALLEAAARLKKLPEYAKQVEWAPTRDGELVPASPLSLLQDCKMSKIPFICGTMRDEGTFMLVDAMKQVTSGDTCATGSCLPNSTGSGSMNSTNPAPDISLMSASDYLAASWALSSNSQQRILQAYPDDQVLGAPFGSGNKTFGLPTQYKQVAAILTDGQWTSRSRAMLSANRKAWGYVFAAGPRESAIHPAYLGYTHGDDVAYIMGGKVLNYWINFAYYLNPNGQDKKGQGNAALSTFWEAYGNGDGGGDGDGRIMRMSANGTWMVSDDARKNQVQVFFCPKVARAMYW